ncbi:MAG: hypothetical protein HYV27_25375 [Candidatus Hydrogenedentes bacterium]|nr:hypothetical protein [Candidatus Hydrogenedentota bacterium]
MRWPARLITAALLHCGIVLAAPSMLATAQDALAVAVQESAPLPAPPAVSPPSVDEAGIYRIRNASDAEKGILERRIGYSEDGDKKLVLKGSMKAAPKLRPPTPRTPPAPRTPVRPQPIPETPPEAPPLLSRFETPETLPDAYWDPYIDVDTAQRPTAPGVYNFIHPAYPRIQPVLYYTNYVNPWWRPAGPRSFPFFPRGITTISTTVGSPTFVPTPRPSLR